MKKFALLALLSFSTLFAAELTSDDIDGYDIYNRDCKQCHVEFLTKSETMTALKAKKLLAPPMVEVSKRIQEVITVNLDNEEARLFVHHSFIKAYLKQPDIFTSLCQDHAKETFGVMPAQTQLTDAEAQAVAEWIIDRFEDVEF